jgi:hypothetical protein
MNVRRSPYPCAGGNKQGSFCVDYDPPQKFKCGCLPGYDAVLPNASDVTGQCVQSNGVPSSVFQGMCVSVSFAMRTQPALYLLTTQQFAFATTTLLETASPIALRPEDCRSKKPPVVTTDLAKLTPTVTNSRTLFVWMGLCKCKAGFYQSNGKGQCMQ